MDKAKIALDRRIEKVTERGEGDRKEMAKRGDGDRKETKV